MSAVGHPSEPSPTFHCFICDKTYSTRQGLENHILNAKTLCYAGAIPQGLDSYLIDHNRSLCLPCRKIFTRRPSCLSCNLATTPNWVQTPSSTRSDIQTPIVPEAILHNLPQIQQAALSVLPEVQPTIQLDPIGVLSAVLDDPTMIIPVIPLPAVRHVSNAFDRTLKALNQDPSSLEAHARLLLFGPYVLASKTNPKHKQSYITMNRARRFCEASLEEIFDTISNESNRNEIPIDGPSKHKRTPIKAIKKLVSLGRPGDAIRQLNSGGVHRTTPDIIERLESLHPQSDPLIPDNVGHPWVWVGEELKPKSAQTLGG